MSSYSTIIDFKGALTFKKIGQLITALNARRNQFNIGTGVFKKLTSLIIEILENILKYSDHYNSFIKNNPDFEPEFHLSRNASSYLLRAVNPIKQQDMLRVKQKIDLINNLNQDEMRILYRKTLTNGEFTEKGGAGLGFFEMVKLSGHPIQYNFESLFDGFLNFELQLHLDNNSM
ncbi:MAG: hypothetical protein AMS27_02165 [Bacteroides sp. SM23_62_1]|nr:MAG: hypothetical protein AMS27_02165 [Bacteroides sp. SM23_62_1]